MGFLLEHLFLVNLYPPALGAGVRVSQRDPYTIETRMGLHLWNRNAVGTHFGGSLYSMCDPWFMLILMRHLGRGYVVWDKSATIDFLRPGRGTVEALFHVPPEKISEIRTQVDAGEKLEPVFSTQVLDARGEAVARVEKRLYIRKAKPPGPE